MENISNKNDKCLVTLYRIWGIDNKRRQRLEKIYPNPLNDQYVINQYLAQEKFIEFNGKLLNGEWIEDEEMPITITLDGKRILQNNALKSETYNIKISRNIKAIKIIGVLLAIIASILSIIKFFIT